MLHPPKFKSCYRVEIVDSVGVFLLSELDSYVLKGRTYERIAPLIDGCRTADEIVDRLQPEISAAEAYYALMQMERKGYIVEDSGELPLEIAAIADILKVHRQPAAEALQSTKVSVRSFGAVDAKPFLEKLQSLNIQVCEDGDIEVVLTDDYLREGLAEWNQKAMQLQRPWMLVKPAGTSIWIGPIFHPEKTPCWECLAQRLRSNRPIEQFIQKKKGIPESSAFAPAPAFYPTAQIGLDLAASELVKWVLKRENPALEGKVITFDALALKTESHTAVKRPQCEACGAPEYWQNRHPSPIILTSGKKTFTADGGHRSFSPEATLKKYEHHISPIAGAVKYMKQASQRSEGVMHLYYSGHNFSRISADDLYFLKKGIRNSSAGKGKTEIQAKASAVCEALERYSGLYQGYETRYKGTLQRMGEAAIHPNACMNFSEEQYRTRREWNASSTSDFNKVFEPFDETREIEWTPVWSFTGQTWKYLPTAFCYYAYPDYPNTVCGTDSNGCAAGNTKEEAIVQGFMELVERDSVALWWYNRVKRPAVDLESFGDPYCQALKDYYKTFNREFWVLDLTADMKIPVFVAISRRTDKPVEDIIFGFGAHFEPKIALLRALTEMNQILPAVSEVAPDGSVRYSAWEDFAIEWWETATVENQPYLITDANIPAKRLGDYEYLATDDLKEDVETCVKLLDELGLEMLVLDQTRPDIGLNVVKVIVPGMRHFWRRLAPGRLYDVPVKLGWLPAPLSEDELNPIPVFF
ncbi:MAG: TOMM precursor leader peptide-binding protein [Oscillatoria sp. Prado101]|jgi:ribosomal protein S12 methylthiotransferase accessory factor|nr:TOMM precursor leader peptide-binding protein [Oscillatoria sp. Prado101]